MSADTQLESILNSVLKEVCMRGDFIHAEALKPAGNTCIVQGGAYYNANANAAEFHKASLNFHYPQFACMPGRVWKTQQTEWHQDVSSLPQAIFVRAQLAKVTGLKACYAIPLTRQGHVVSVVVFYSRTVMPYDEQLELTVFTLANDMLKDVCQRFGQTQLQFVNHGKAALTRRPRTGTSKVWECAKASLDTDPDKRTEADVENIIKFSKRLPFFKYVSTTAREALCRKMQHIILQEGEVPIKPPKDIDYTWFIVVKGRCDMMLKTEETGKHYPMRAFEEGDTFAYSYLKMLTGDLNAQEQGEIRAREPNTSVVRVYVEEEHRGDFRSQTKPLLYEELAKYFNMAADQAAERLGLCMSAIKKICRRHGIVRWPHRKLLSANKSLALIDSKMMEVEQTPQCQAMLRSEAIGVLVSKLRVMLNPTYLVNSELVQVQPSSGGGHQVPGRVDDVFELEGSLSPDSEGDMSDEDSPPAGGAKRKKNGKGPNGVNGKDKKDKKSRMNHPMKGMGHGNNAKMKGEGIVWGGQFDGRGAAGAESIEFLSNMVRASLEKVPENVREQVLTSVITGMHGGSQGKHAGVAGAVSAAQQGGPRTPLLPQHMAPPGAYPYMQIPGIQPHALQFANQHMAAKQSMQGSAGIAGHFLPGQDGSGTREGAAALNQHLAMASYPRGGVSGPNATRHDDSSDDEGGHSTVSAALPTWTGPGGAHQSLDTSLERGGDRFNLQHGHLDRILSPPAAFTPQHTQGYARMPGNLQRDLQQYTPHGPSSQPGHPGLNLQPLMPPLPGVNAGIASSLGKPTHLQLPAAAAMSRQGSGKSMEVLGMLSASAGDAADRGSGGEGAQPKTSGEGIWSNIHLLCDLLGGAPLSQAGGVGQGTVGSAAASQAGGGRSM